MSALACPKCRREPGGVVRPGRWRNARVHIECGCGEVFVDTSCDNPYFGRGGRAADTRRRAILREHMIAAGCVEMDNPLPMLPYPSSRRGLSRPALQALMLAKALSGGPTLRSGNLRVAP